MIQEDQPLSATEDGYRWLLTRDPAAESVLDELRKGCPELVDLLIKNLYHDLYQRDGLDLKTRLLVTVACAAASGATPQVTYQSRFALLNGVTVEELYEVLFNVALFSGFSNAMNAMNAIKTAISTLQPGDNTESAPHNNCLNRR